MERTITVKGTGRVHVKPDYIVLSMSLKAQDVEYAKAMELAAERLEQLRNAVAAVGFKRDELKTASFDVEPEFQSVRDDNGNYSNRFVGYVCNHSLAIEFDLDMKRLAQTFSALAKCRAEPEYSVQFTAKDKDALSVQMLRSAAENAKVKAEVLCQAAGVELGELLTIEYNWGELHLSSATKYNMSDIRLAQASPVSSIEIEPDDIHASDTVTFVWEIS